MSRVFLVVAAFCLSTIGASTAQGDASAGAFAQLRTLAGDWEGSFEWTGARSGAGTVTAAYSLTGMGSAVVENLTMGGVPSMTSVYHMDGTDLRLTHYCGAQNQPRLKAQRIDVAHGSIDFTFVDITNLRSPDAGHVHGLEMRLIDADHVILTFLFESGGQHSREQITLKRLPQKPSGKGEQL